MLVEEKQLKFPIYKRKLNQRERVHAKAPHSNISMIMTIIGKVNSENLREVIKKMQIRHPILNTHVEIKGNEVWLIGNEDMKIPLKVIPREGDNQWNQVIIKEHKIPINMTEGPLIRFILLHSNKISDLIIFCQHTICDGMALTYLARDIMTYLGNPSEKLEPLPMVHLDKDDIPKDIKPPLSVRLFKGLIKKKWKKVETIFDYQDFNELHKVFWKKFTYKAELYQLLKEDTKAFIKECKKNGVTVNAALIAAFSIAQNKVNPKSPKYLTKFASAVDLRNLLVNPVGEQFGFFAGGIQFQYKYSDKHSLWDVAKKIYKKADPKKSRKKALVSTLSVFQFPGTLLESKLYAAFGNLIPPSSPRYDKMQQFLNDKHNFIAKKVQKQIENGTVLAQIMTNLGKTNFPERYGDYILGNLILMPSSSPYTELAIAVITHGGTLSITLNHMESTISTEKVLKIKDFANQLIMDAIQK